MTIQKETAGKTATCKELAYKYLDARAEVVGLPKAKGILIMDGISNEDEDYDDFTFRKAFMMLQDEVGNVIILPRQLDYCYDVEQYHDVFLPEQADFLVEWFKAQKQMDESFTYYVDNQYDFFEDIISGNNVLTEKYEGSGRCRVVSVLTK